MFDRIDDTIVAISSPPGHSPRGLVRLTGPDALPIAGRMFRSVSGAAIDHLPSASQMSGVLWLEEDISLPCRISVFRAPASYTGQDSVEFHLVGSPTVLEMVVEQLIRFDARPAESGEFTARRFFAGKIDLSRAEAIAALIHADSSAQLRAARRAMNETLADHVSLIQDRLVGLLALVEADIDFAEEPIDFISPQKLRADAGEIVVQLRSWLADEATQRRTDPRPHILMLGRPNAGKSTLMNRLSGSDRAIASPLAGTTRDLLSAEIILPTGPALLMDAAGIADDEDKLSRAAADRALAGARRVDLILHVVDLSAEYAAPPWQHGDDDPPIIQVGNKCDLIDLGAVTTPADCAIISARTGDGIEDLIDLIVTTLRSGTSETAVLLLTARQRTAVEAAADALDQLIHIAEQTSETIDAADLLAFELRDAVNHLAQITGQVTTEDLLRKVFAEFCIGK